MDKNLFYTSRNKLGNIWLIPAIMFAVFMGIVIAKKGIAIGFLLLVLPFAAGFMILIFFRPRLGIIGFLIYCFVMPTIGRHIAGLQVGLGMEALLFVTLFAVIFHQSNRFRKRHLNIDLFWVIVAWGIMTILQIGNPERPSILGWVYEMRTLLLYWILTVSLSILLLNKRSDIDLFLNIIILFSFAGALYGMKQLYIGLDDAENTWLENGGKVTHVIFGKLRIFSYYFDAAQFGASQAQLAIMCIILATGPYSFKKKLWYFIAGMFILYGMLISGTRGAMFALIGGGFAFLVLIKQTEILIVGAVVGLTFIGILKYTNIGNGSAEIVRLRSSLDPDDPSLQLRFMNQKRLSDYLSSKPFGAGVGTMGQWGESFNSDKYISHIAPDSLYVKIWGMYGIVGFLTWFGIMLYITGKSAGIIWKTRDPVLKNQLICLCAGSTGILLCSYGNEVLNTMPTSAVVYISWALIWLSPRWDTPVNKADDIALNTPEISDKYEYSNDF
ncbi:O-antigen ligase family protein [Arcicella aquatica]|uniref:O-antigen ligase family protein n=1 Tax=Arcicella aquatica TaxID=217141 RepID=A0ABU5QP46_9BACT|nr:O-antigen ligase family protein [Arcicella aquatica]MEA5258186.1 O-antigen ligase family protein [Arcicella aquatica]